MAAAMGSQSVGDQLIPLWRARPEVVLRPGAAGGAYDPSEKTITGLAPSAQFPYVRPGRGILPRHAGHG